MSLKDKGNQEVKKGNLEKAIDYYLLYVKDDNKDNEAAYTNLAQCYFKLKDYKKSIQACENALDEKRQFPKAYYRLYMAYRELPDEEFQVFMNAYLFLKYYQEDNQSTKNEATKIIKQFKQKFTKKIVFQERKIEESIIADLQSLGNQCIKEQFEKKKQKENSLSDWTTYFEDQMIPLEDKVDKIKEIFIKQNQLGSNLGYFLLNLIVKQEDKESIAENIKKIRIQYEKKEQSAQETKPYEDESEKDKQQQENSNTNNKDEIEKKIPLSQSSQLKKPPSKKSKKIKDKSSSTHNESKDKKQSTEEKPNQQKPTKNKKKLSKQKSGKLQPQTVPQPLPIERQEIEHKFQQFLNSYKHSQDVFKDFFPIIRQILRANLPQQAKKAYLLQIQKSCRETSLLKKSLSSEQKKELLELLKASELQNEFDWHEPISDKST